MPNLHYVLIDTLFENRIILGKHSLSTPQMCIKLNLKLNFKTKTHFYGFISPTEV